MTSGDQCIIIRHAFTSDSTFSQKYLRIFHQNYQSGWLYLIVFKICWKHFSNKPMLMQIKSLKVAWPHFMKNLRTPSSIQSHKKLAGEQESKYARAVNSHSSGCAFQDVNIAKPNYLAFCIPKHKLIMLVLVLEHLNENGNPIMWIFNFPPCFSNTKCANQSIHFSFASTSLGQSWVRIDKWHAHITVKALVFGTDFQTPFYTYKKLFILTIS